MSFPVDKFSMSLPHRFVSGAQYGDVIGGEEGTIVRPTVLPRRTEKQQGCIVGHIYATRHSMAKPVLGANAYW